MGFYYWLKWFLAVLISGYTYIAPVLIFASLFAKANRPITGKWIAIANGWFCVYAISAAWLIFIDWYNQNQYEGYSFDYKDNLIAGNSLYQVFMIFSFSKFLLLIFAVLFFFRKCRRSILITSFCYISIFSVPIFLFFANPALEPKPRAWVSFQVTEPWWENLFLCLFIYALIIASTYFIQQKRKQTKILSLTFQTSPDSDRY